VGAIAAIVVFAVILGIAYLAGQGERRRLDGVWQNAAAELGGRFDEGNFWTRGRRVEATVDGTPVTLDHTVGKHAVTRAAANAAHADGFFLKLTRAHVFSGIGEALGMQDVLVGDVAFDEQFVVKTNDVGLARAWLDHAMRRALMACADTRFELRDGVVQTVRGGVVDDARSIELVARATGRLAGRGGELRRWWQERAKASGSRLEREPEGGWRFAIDDRPVPVRIETRLPDAVGATTTRVVALLADRSNEVYRLERADGDEPPSTNEALPKGYRFASEDPDKAGRRFPELHDTIAELAPRHIACDGEEVTLEVEDVDGDPDKLERAIALATALAARHGGPYR
jgi:hypothetical protein